MKTRTTLRNELRTSHEEKATDVHLDSGFKLAPTLKPRTSNPLRLEANRDRLAGPHVHGGHVGRLIKYCVMRARKALGTKSSVSKTGVFVGATELKRKTVCDTPSQESIKRDIVRHNTGRDKTAWNATYMTDKTVSAWSAS